jgi:hypothetical protein
MTHLNHARPYQKRTSNPVLTAIVFSFLKVVAQEKQQQKNSTKKPLSIFENYYQKTILKLKRNGKVVATKKYSELTPKENIVPPLSLKNKHLPLKTSIKPSKKWMINLW